MKRRNFLAGILGALCFWKEAPKYKSAVVKCDGPKPSLAIVAIPAPRVVDIETLKLLPFPQCRSVSIDESEGIDFRWPFHNKEDLDKRWPWLKLTITDHNVFLDSEGNAKISAPHVVCHTIMREVDTSWKEIFKGERA